VLLGERPRDPRASVRWGARVRVAYYDQTLARFDPDATSSRRWCGSSGSAAHDLLGRFLFPYEAQFKRVGDLSGGERARLALLELTLAEATCWCSTSPPTTSTWR
jgi:ATPase subunit of ABC transporter with duplicated ATPase domains